MGSGAGKPIERREADREVEAVRDSVEVRRGVSVPRMQILRPVQVLALRTRLQPQRRLQKPGAEIPAGSSPAKLLLDSRVKLFKRNSRFRVRLVLRQARVDQLFLLVSERVVLIEPF